MFSAVPFYAASVVKFSLDLGLTSLSGARSGPLCFSPLEGSRGLDREVGSPVLSRRTCAAFASICSRIQSPSLPLELYLNPEVFLAISNGLISTVFTKFCAPQV